MIRKILNIRGLFSRRPKEKSAAVQFEAVKGAKEDKISSLKRVNAVLFIVWLVSLGIVFINIYAVLSSRTRLDIEDSQDVTDISLESDSRTELPLSHYEDIFSRRELFKVAEISQKTTANAADIQTVPAELLQNYSLVGVIGGDSPLAVIEDKKTHQTSSLGKGQYFNGMKVADIREGKVIFEVNGRSVELSL